MKDGLEKERDRNKIKALSFRAKKKNQGEIYLTSLKIERIVLTIAATVKLDIVKMGNSERISGHNKKCQTRFIFLIE